MKLYELEEQVIIQGEVVIKAYDKDLGEYVEVYEEISFGHLSEVPEKYKETEVAYLYSCDGALVIDLEDEE